ncbi:MAG: nitroreductase [Candidatus Nealsonbacteria bacterium]|nr:MAG: nitroreductase [Candidatus Nealsonbacteria bacterium]
MEVFEAITKRRSVRKYKPEPIPEEKLRRILEAARLAPSAHNAQEWRFIVVREEERRKKIAEASHQSFVAEAPVIIVLVSLNPEHIMSGGAPAYAVDLGIAGEHIALQAVEEGLGTCWIGAFSQEKVKEILNIPAQYKVVALLTLGYPADKDEGKERKDFNQVVSFEEFKN